MEGVKLFEKVLPVPNTLSTTEEVYRRDEIDRTHLCNGNLSMSTKVTTSFKFFGSGFGSMFESGDEPDSSTVRVASPVGIWTLTAKKKDQKLPPPRKHVTLFV